MVQHVHLQLPAFSRGFHLITDKVLQAVPQLPENGLLNIYIMHTSAGLCINENADPSVRVDMDFSFDRLVPEDLPEYTHTYEGSDDMPAHVKSVLTGNSISIPIINNRLVLGTWQGIYLGEFRDRASGRKLIISIYQ